MIQAAPSAPVMTPWGAEPGPERDLADGPGRRIEVAEDAVVLARVPDAAVRRGRDVVGMRAGRDVELARREGDAAGRG